MSEDTYPFVFMSCVVTRLDKAEYDPRDSDKTETELIREFEDGVNEMLTKLQLLTGLAPSKMTYVEEIEFHDPINDKIRIETVVEVNRESAKGVWMHFASSHTGLAPIAQYIEQAKHCISKETVEKYEHYPRIEKWLAH